MTSDDRELLQQLRRQQMELQRSLARIDVRLEELEARAGTLPQTEAGPPPVPSFLLEHISPPPLRLAEAVSPVVAEELPPVPLPPLPQEPVSPLFPPIPPPPPARSFEFHLGRWVLGLAVVLGVITLSIIFNYTHGYIFKLLGPSGVLGLSAAAGFGLIVLSERLIRREGSARYVGRGVTAMSLAWLYLTAYAAHAYPALKVIESPFTAGLLLLAWSAYVFLLAERRGSQLLGLFAIILAYFSSALNPIDRFTMIADLLLATTAVTFLVRKGWSSLSYFSLLGTYLIFLRRLVIDDSGDLVLDTSRTLHFWPHATYVFGAWLIFTAAVIFTSSLDFRGGKRLAFLSLNNGLFSGLLLLTAWVTGHGQEAMGSTLLFSGAVLLFASRFVGWTLVEPERVMAAYAAQGLALFTAGIIVYFTGVTRGFLLTLETLFLGAAATFAGDRVLRITTYFAGFFATLFLIFEMAVNAHQPWLLGISGSWVMLINAWWARNDYRFSAHSRSTIVLATSYYCALALGIIYTSLSTTMSDTSLPPALAFSALALTFLVYFVAIYELPPLAQLLLVAAQILVLFPADTGETLPWTTTFWVAAITLLMITWWGRQRVTRSGSWILLLNLFYALALAGLAYQTVHPRVDEHGWMISAGLISVLFLAWGAFTRIWPIALVSQLFLLNSVYLFFTLPPEWNSSWSWLGYIFPLVLVFATARATHQWLHSFPEIEEFRATTLKAFAYLYQVVSLGMLVRAIFVLVDPLDHVSIFFFLGTLILVLNLRPPNPFAIRCGIALSFIGLLVYASTFRAEARALTTFFNALAFLSFLSQPALLRHRAPTVLTTLESWALVVFSAGGGWLFTSVWVHVRINPAYLTLGWAVYAFFLFLFGLLVQEKRFRWCGIALLVPVFIRVVYCDFWGLSSGYKVITFLMLTCIMFAIAYFLLKRPASPVAAESPLPPVPPPPPGP